MNRRTFLQLLLLAVAAPFVTLPTQAAAAPVAGQWVFDGVNGLTFPAVAPTRGCVPTATRVVNLRALTFLERLFGGIQ
jgi:hypothetical protein